MRSVNADVCYINANKHQTHSFISSIISTNSMHDAMLGTGEKNRHGLAYDGVHILMEETENKEYIYIYINTLNISNMWENPYRK